MIHYLTVDQAIKAQFRLVQEHGGVIGIRDVGLLTSAMEMPKIAYNGQDVHVTIFHKAAAYLFHLIKNHPFIDGNKRTGAFLAILFLRLNNVQLLINQKQYETLVIGIAAGLISKAQISLFFEKSQKKRPKTRKR